MKASKPIRRASSIVVVRQVDPARTLEVLLIKRRDFGIYANLWAFPGGCFEPSDKTSKLLQHHSAPSSLKSEELVRRYTGMRQTFEEVGLPIVKGNITDLEESRKKSGQDYQAFIKDLGLVPDFGGLIPILRFITPDVPIVKTIYDTEFYLYCLEDSSFSDSLSLQTKEVKSAEWYSPASFLKSLQRKQKYSMSTQWLILHYLSQFRDVKELKEYSVTQLSCPQFSRYPIVPSYTASNMKYFKSKQNKKLLQVTSFTKLKQKPPPVFEIYPGDEEYDNALFEKYTQEDPEVKQFIASEGMRN